MLITPAQLLVSILFECERRDCQVKGDCVQNNSESSCGQNLQDLGLQKFATLEETFY